MATLEDGQFELDGVKFGLFCPMSVTAEGFSPGHAELVGSSTKLSGADGVKMGRRRYGSANWSFQLFADRSTPAEALESYATLGSVWPKEQVRLNPDSVSTLRYAIGGRTRVVFGQGGRWSPAVNNSLLGGTLAVAADFETIDHLHYSDTVYSSTVGIGAVASQGGLIPPFIPPVTSFGSNVERTGQITVGGDRPTPCWIKFNGPISDARVSVAGFNVELQEAVFANDPVTVDSRPWARSATRQSGGGVRVNPRVTNIAKLLLPPGSHTVKFYGSDPSAKASATVHWRNAYSHL